MRAVARWGWLCVAVACADRDGDGWRGGRDCDDDDARVFAGAAEVCDGVDNDCDGQVDEDVAFVAWQDRDGDGFGDPARARRVCELPADGVLNGDDCDDLDALTFPRAPELCDGRDNDCDTVADEEVGLTFYRDADGDGHGVPGDTTTACVVPVGFSRLADDCDDGEPLAWTGAEEVCDGVDNDCNGGVDEGIPLGWWPADGDGDGYGHPTALVEACGPGAPGAAAAGDDCDDGDDQLHPGAPESRRVGLDDDCDGYVDEVQVPTDAATVLAGLALVGPGEVLQVVGVVEEDVDLRGYDVVLAGEGCARSALLGTGAGPTLWADGGRIEGLTLMGGRDAGVVVSGDVVARRVCVEGNTSQGNGGGIRVEAGSLVLEDSRVADNVAAFDGGGVAVQRGAELVARRVSWAGNEAGDSGGGLYIAGAPFDVAASVFAGNVAKYDGGGMAVGTEGSGTVEGFVDQCTFVSNETTWDTLNPSRADQSRGSALATLDIQSKVVVTSSGFAFQRGVDDVVQIVGDDSVIEGVAFHANGGRDVYTGWVQEALTAPPRFVRFDPSTSPSTWDLRLMPGSPWIDAGSDVLRDPDGSRADLGAFGGPRAPAEGTEAYRQDRDGDGMWDAWERAWGFVVGVDDGGGDADGDGLDNVGEQRAWSNPRLPDTDGDAWTDGEEVGAGTDPTVAGDRLPFAAVDVPRVWIPRVAVPLDGRSSYDPDSSTASLSWTLVAPAGSAVTSVAAPTAALTSFTPDVSGTWRITLRVSDARGVGEFTVAVNVRDAVVVPDQQPTLVAALAAAGASGSVALRPGTWDGGVTLSGYSGTIFGLGAPSEVVIRGTSGSVVNVRDGSTPRLQQLTLRGGAASASGDTHGGGVDCNSGSVTLTDAVVEENTATGNGGGIYASNCPVTLDRVMVRANSGNHGGGIYLNSSYLLMLRSQLVDNVAAGFGGGIRYNSTVRDAMTVQNTLLQGNVANDGSAVALRGPTLRDLVLSLRNVAVVDHGGPGAVVLVERGSAVVMDSLFLANRGRYGLEEAGGTLTSLRLAVWGQAMPLASRASLVPRDLVTAWPMVGSWVDDGDASNDALLPRPGSPLLGSGSPHVEDLDRTLGDIGLTGGLDVRRGWLREAVDMDRDGMSDGWELRYGLDPTRDDGALDADGDGVSNLQEYRDYTLPDRLDTDGDGVWDGR